LRLTAAVIPAAAGRAGRFKRTSFFFPPGTAMTRILENKTGTPADQAPDRSAAVRTFRQWRVRDGLLQFEPLPALIAFVFVDGHGFSLQCVHSMSFTFPAIAFSMASRIMV
jgi:hypothetical protein